MALIKRTFMEARPIEIGKIKIGTRGAGRSTSAGGTSYLPERLDHFLVTTLEREGDKNDGPFKRDMAVHGHADVGEKPRELLGTLMYPTIEQNLHTEMCVYASRRRKSTCDGEQKVMRDGASSPCQAKPKGPGCACKPFARLHLQLAVAPQMGGYYVYRTSGWASTNNLQTALEEIYRAFGTLYQAPVKLFMQKTPDTYMDGTQERTGWSEKVGLVLNMPFSEAQEYLQEKARKAISTRDLLMLEAGDLHAEGGAVAADLDEADLANEGELADEFAPPKCGAASVGTHAKLADALEQAREQEPDREIVQEEDDGPEETPDDSASGPDAPLRPDAGGSGGDDDPHPAVGFLTLASE